MYSQTFLNRHPWKYNKWHLIGGFVNVFNRRATGFHRFGKAIRIELLCKKNFLLDGQKLPSQPVNLPSAWPLMKPLRYGRSLLTLGYTIQL